MVSTAYHPLRGRMRVGGGLQSCGSSSQVNWSHVFSVTSCNTPPLLTCSGRERREKDVAGPGGQVAGGMSQETYVGGLSPAPQDEISAPPPSLEVSTETLMGLSHVHCLEGLNTTSLSWACVLGAASGNREGNVHPKDRGLRSLWLPESSSWIYCHIYLMTSFNMWIIPIFLFFQKMTLTKYTIERNLKVTAAGFCFKFGADAYPKSSHASKCLNDFPFLYILPH